MFLHREIIWAGLALVLGLVAMSGLIRPGVAQDASGERFVDAMLGEMRFFAGGYAPTGWAFCHGQLLSIDQNNALFSIIGTYYGGDGRTTFALPDMRGRVLIGTGSGPGVDWPEIQLGDRGGRATLRLPSEYLPLHTHPSTVETNSTDTTDVYISRDEPVANMPPYLGGNCIIAIEGAYPSRG